jgi:hypothetical protein
MAFLAQDDIFPETLLFYLDRCVLLGCDQEHLDAVKETYRRLLEWRKANPERCHAPGAKGEKLLV